MFQVAERHEETSLGLPYPVVLHSAAEIEVNEEGQTIGLYIPNHEGLMAAVVISRCLIPVRLDGCEVRFIRKVIGKTAKEFAGDLEMDPATFSRWENEKQSVGAWADKQVRQAAIILLRDQAQHLRANPADVVNLRFVGEGTESITAIEMELVSDCSGEEPQPWYDVVELKAA